MKYQTRISEVRKLENGIIRVEFIDDSELEAKDLDELLILCKDLIPAGEKALFLNIFPENLTGDLDFGRISANHAINELRKAQAIVVKNIPQRIQSTFYRSFFSLGFPLKIFNKEESAINWLLSIDCIETSISIIQKLEEDLVRVEVKESAVINVEGLRENLEVYREIIANESYFITIFSDSNTSDRSAKLPFEASERVQLKKGEAFVVESLANRIELEYHINRTKQLYPTKVFELEEDALEFIDSLRNNEKKE